jgi:hypothetical protein
MMFVDIVLDLSQPSQALSNFVLIRQKFSNSDSVRSGHSATEANESIGDGCIGDERLIQYVMWLLNSASCTYTLSGFL